VKTPQNWDDLDDFVEAANLDPEFQFALLDAEGRATLRSRLIQARKDLRLSQQDVAKCMSCTQSTVSEFESGATDPYLSTLQRYARAVCGQIRTEFIPQVAPPVELIFTRPWQVLSSSKSTSIAETQQWSLPQHGTAVNIEWSNAPA
jgi:transcriptional regulator with XRE-family HTH domain